jgi:hypothetical protein
MASAAVELLRKQLREKFPEAHGARQEPAPPAPAGQRFEAASFPAGAISEVVPGGPAAGISLVIAGLLGDPAEPAPHPELVLVDGSDAFDPASFTGAACSKLLWVRCRTPMETLKAADLLVRDGNVPFILLDATGLPRRDLAAVPASAWWRLKQTLARGAVRLVVLAPFPLVPCAGIRLTLTPNFTLQDLDLPRQEILARSAGFSRPEARIAIQAG